MRRTFRRITAPFAILFTAAFVLAACAVATPRVDSGGDTATVDVYKKAIYKQSRWPFGLH